MRQLRAVRRPPCATASFLYGWFRFWHKVATLMRRTLLALVVGLALWMENVPAESIPMQISLPGARPDGSVLLPNQWSLRPAGRQVPLGDFPVNIAMHPGSRYAAVLHSGYGKHQVIVVDLTTLDIVCQTNISEASTESSSPRMAGTLLLQRRWHGGCSLIHLWQWPSA